MALMLCAFIISRSRSSCSREQALPVAGSLSCRLTPLKVTLCPFTLTLRSSAMRTSLMPTRWAIYSVPQWSSRV